MLPVLLFLVLGVAEFGQFFYIRAAFAAAARDAARAACLQTAASTDPATKAAATLAQANVTFQPSWMTIVDATNSNAAVSDVTSVPYGDTLVVTISTTYGSIPNAYRPLYAMTGVGVSPAKPCAGVCRMIRE